MMIDLLRRLGSPAFPAAARTEGGASTRRDPLDSPLWGNMAERFLPDLPVVFDERVQVGLPNVTENQTQVPVTIDARALGRVEEIIVIADLNPFPLTLRMETKGAQAFLGFRMKIEQGTPIRAAVRQDGVWRVGGGYLDAAGGGCSVPPVTEKKTDWKSLGETRARLWRESDAGAQHLRLRLRVTHPMDTGMMNNLPLFLIEDLAISDAEGAMLAKLELKEPVADNPTLTLLLDLPASGDHLKIRSRNTAGVGFASIVPIPAAAAPRSARMAEEQP